MQIKLLNEIVQEIAGELAIDVLNLLMGKKNVNEFLIAKKLDLTINQVRNIFYKLANFGLVSFTRKKDKRKGWYTYFWTLNSDTALDLLDKRLSKEIDTLKHQSESRKTKRFYSCKICHTEVSEETALLHNFTCQECGEIYQLSESENKIGDIDKRIIKLERQRKNVLEEIDKLNVLKKKKIVRAEKKAKKEKSEKARATKEKRKKDLKAAERKEAREKTKKKKAKSAKKKPKSKGKKKPAKKKGKK